jgi:hypothetical protein
MKLLASPRGEAMTLCFPTFPASVAFCSCDEGRKTRVHYANDAFEVIFT